MQNASQNPRRERVLQCVIVSFIAINFAILFAIPYYSAMTETEFVVVTYQLDNLQGIGKIGMLDHWVHVQGTYHMPGPTNALKQVSEDTLGGFLNIMVGTGLHPAMSGISFPHILLWALGVASVPLILKFTKGVPVQNRAMYCYLVAVLVAGTGGRYWIFS